MNNPKTSNFLVPDNVLQQLLAASSSSSLTEALLSLIETAKTPEGRLLLASKHIIVPALELCKSPIQISSEHLCFCLSIKLLRNLCAGEIKNQNSFIELDGVAILSAVIYSLGLTSAFENGIFRAVLQVLGNVSLAGEMHRQVIWQQFFPNGFRDIARFRSCKICDPLSMIIYVCCEGSNERVDELLSDRGRHIVMDVVQTVTEDGFEESWVKLLLYRICIERPCFHSVFSTMTEAEKFDHYLSCINHFRDEQATLLSILSETISDQVGGIAVSDEFCRATFSILRKAVEIVDFNTKGKSSLPSGSTDIDVLGYSLSILIDISASDHSENEVDPISTLASAGLIEFLLDLLRDLQPPATIRKAMIQSSDISRQGSKHCPYKGFRRDIVAIIGNCSYRRKTIQDEIREQNGIVLLLQQCLTDEDNPFLRERGIWSMRNVLEGSTENQNVVAELEMNRTVDTPEMTELGIRVEFDPKSRRPKLVNTS